MASIHRFDPDYSVPPGATLKETLDAQGLSQADLSMRTSLSEKTISQIVNGIAPISYETAERLELATGVPASFWNRRELSYREALARRAEVGKFQAEVKWLKEIPMRALVDREFIRDTSDKPDLVRQVLKFFGVSSVESWRQTWGNPIVQFRGKRAQDRHPGYVAAWLRIGELQAAGVECEPFDAREFKRALVDIRPLSVSPASVWSKQMPERCAAAGVVVVFTKEIRSAGVSGATRWLTKDKALVQLSLKYKTDDQLWFTVFHEAGHILLHGKKQLFLDFGAQSDTEEDEEANVFARDFLIPPEAAQRLPYLRNRPQIRQFAKSLNVAPGIVVGRLQRDGLLHHSQCNNLKRELDWGER